MHKLQWIEHKIYDRAGLIMKCNSLRATGKTIVFTNGCFDILHHGHLDLLARAADLGHALVVGVNTDASVKRLKGHERPVNTEADRCFQLASLLCTDAICMFDEDTPETLIQAVRPDVLVKGGDYNINTIVGAPFVQHYGGRVEIIPFVTGYSTSNLIARIRSL